MTTTKSRKRNGRPKGSKTQHVPAVDTYISSCPKCKSTNRAGYFATITREYSGVTPDGMPYNRISWKRTKCLNCGQHRIDKTYENLI